MSKSSLWVSVMVGVSVRVGVMLAVGESVELASVADNLLRSRGYRAGLVFEAQHRFGDLDGVIAHAEEIKGKIGENLRAALDQLPLSKELVTIRRDVALEVGSQVEVAARKKPITFLQPRGALPFWDLLRQKATLLPD